MQKGRDVKSLNVETEAARAAAAEQSVLSRMYAEALLGGKNRLMRMRLQSSEGRDVKSLSEVRAHPGSCLSPLKPEIRRCSEAHARHTTKLEVSAAVI